MHSIGEHEEKKEEEEPDYKVRQGWFWSLVLNGSLPYFYVGFQGVIFNPLQDNIAHDLLLSEEEKTKYLAIISAILFIGGFFGSAVVGKIAATIGRKMTFVIINAVSIVAVGLHLIDNRFAMIVARFICGLTFGAHLTLVPVYITEFSPGKYIEMCAGVYSTVLGAGICSAFAFGTNCPDAEKFDLVWWRICFCALVPFLVLNIILFLTVFKLDTPLYYLEVLKDRQSCEDALKIVYEDPEEINKIITKMEDAIKENEAKEEIGYRVLFCSGRFTRQLVIGLLFTIAWNFCGYVAFDAYSTEIFKRTMDKKMSTIFSLLTGVMSLIGSVVSIGTFAKIRSKILLVGGYCILCSIDLALVVLEHYKVYEPEKYLVLIFYFMIAAAVFIQYKITAELLPDIGVSFLGLFLMLGTVITTFIFPFMLESSMQFQWSMFLFAVITLLCIIYFGIFYKETDKMKLHVVEELYKTWL